MSTEHPVTNSHDIAQLLTIGKGEQAQVVPVGTSNPAAYERLRCYLEYAMPDLVWVDREKCIYKRPLRGVSRMTDDA